MEQHIAAWSGLAGGLVWLAVWTLPALTARPPAPLCQRQAEVVRGIYHVHSRDHGGALHGDGLSAAMTAMCLDFVVLTEHEGVNPDPSLTDAAIIKGVEAREDRHHHGRLSAWGERFFVLNHPTDSGITSLDDLSSSEREALRTGRAGMEVLNTGRFFKTPASFADLLGVLWAGPARLDLALGMASLPGPDVRLWVEVQRAAARPVVMFCGSDAHGDFWGYTPALSVLVMHLPPSDDVGKALREGLGWCVNELLGTLRWRHRVSALAEGGCDLSIDSPLPLESHWRLIHNQDAIFQGQGSANKTLNAPGVYHLQVWRDIDLGWTGRASRLWAITQAWVITEDRRCVLPQATP